ncbi:hypothetical protein L873DRAFT_1816876 [Choiromyces venosus 120613-1]|uniref:Secreted protein n=1 Tax=Choiromyces venosus 120613-1 TaxID=1336337 RepID=A0A3N4J7B8_9PEZI|nr:hypothetical protein L873DRAFT_1816876 [Choiromyces venosus 120613-1]
MVFTGPFLIFLPSLWLNFAAQCSLQFLPKDSPVFCLTRPFNIPKVRLHHSSSMKRSTGILKIQLGKDLAETLLSFSIIYGNNSFD